ncbi:hypothetical protein ACFYMW_34735 [Streptomyces sp. NPDC006692]|uniref:hypothetical protein n=1 Tax=Streptomyces sp. NPDC006692 TaxID=3364758 RepID=UPI00368BE678
MEKPDRGQLYAMTFVFNGMLLRAADNQRTVSIEAPTLSDALAELTTKYPEMKRIVLDNTGAIAPGPQGLPQRRDDLAARLGAAAC